MLRPQNKCIEWLKNFKINGNKEIFGYNCITLCNKLLKFFVLFSSEDLASEELFFRLP
jgi:hypothetical protein